MSDLLEQVQKGLTAATPGPWEAGEADEGGETDVRHKGALVAVVCSEYDFPCLDPEAVDQTRAECAGNLHLITNAPEWLAQLCKRVREAEEELAKLKGLAKSAVQWCGTINNDCSKAHDDYAALREAIGESRW